MPHARSGPPVDEGSNMSYHNARAFLCAAADELTRDPQVKPGTDLGNQELEVALQALPTDPVLLLNEPACLTALRRVLEPFAR